MGLCISNMTMHITISATCNSMLHKSCAVTLLFGLREASMLSVSLRMKHSCKPRLRKLIRYEYRWMYQYSIEYHSFIIQYNSCIEVGFHGTQYFIICVEAEMKWTQQLFSTELRVFFCHAISSNYLLQYWKSVQTCTAFEIFLTFLVIATLSFVTNSDSQQ